MDKAVAKYRIIEEILNEEDNILNVSMLCSTAGVSRQGYYYWLRTKDVRNEREEQDRKDFGLILEAYNFRGYAKGARGIHMRLLHLETPVVMNHKKIQRLMRKYGLECPIRQANPYRRMQKSLSTENTAENVLDREFRKHGARKVLLTDITYIPFQGKFCYLSTILDAYTKQVLSYVVSESLEVDFVLETVQMAMDRHGLSFSTETLIHSDRGSHYTSKKFIQIVNDSKLRRSMSRRGNCWDNAPQESFFGHMKQETYFERCRTVKELKAAIDDWMDYYNNDRYQESLAKLSPNEYYEYITTGIYPLKI